MGVFCGGLSVSIANILFRACRGVQDMRDTTGSTL